MRLVTAIFLALGSTVADAGYAASCNGPHGLPTLSNGHFLSGWCYLESGDYGGHYATSLDLNQCLVNWNGILSVSQIHSHNTHTGVNLLHSGNHSA